MKPTRSAYYGDRIMLVTTLASYLCFMFLPCPKATAKSVVDMSKAATLQFGASTCPVTQKLSRTHAKRAEDVCHKTFFAEMIIDPFSCHDLV